MGIRARFVAPGVVVVSLGAAALFVAAAYAYPGGTHFDHRVAGHQFWTNTLCDVARSVALDGEINTKGATLARMAMTAMAIALGGFFWLVAAQSRSPTTARLVRTLGSMSVPPMIAVVFLPTDRYSSLHGVAVVTAGVPGLAATALAAWDQARTAFARRALGAQALLGSLTLAVAATDFVVYVDELVRGGPPRLALPILERIAALLLLSWILSVALPRRLTAGSSRDGRPSRAHGS